MGVRLNKYIAESGVCSRRKADELITSGQVIINGKKTFELGVKVDPARDRVTVQGRPIKQEEEKVYILFNKPRQVLTSMEDPEGRPTVADFFENLPYRVFPIGRLDWDSEGMLLLTNDGDYANKVMHPKEEIPKVYLVKLDKHPTDEALHKLRTGVPIPGGRVKAISVERVRRAGTAPATSEKGWYRIVISEGKNRQIRFMFHKVGYDVEKLQRVAIGGLELKNLSRGDSRILTKREAEKVFDLFERKTIRQPKPKTKLPFKTKRILRSNA
jgi:23S rRNA pseudouridine2605 synthase